MNLVVLFVLKNSSLYCIFNYFWKHFRVFDHQISNRRIERVLSVRVSHDEDQTTDNHRQSHGWRVIFPYKRKTYCSLVADIWMIDSIQTFDFGSIYRVHIWKCQLKDNFTVPVKRILSRSDRHVNYLQITFIGKGQSCKIYLLFIVG